VSAIESDGEAAKVKLELETVNQRGEVVVAGDALARLPRSV
jgi:hypothetical protein